MGPAQLSNALDKRRAFILKSQNVQQQRHLTVLKEALDSKEGFVYEVQEDLYKIQDVLRQSIKTLVVFFKCKNIGDAQIELMST